MNTLKNNKVHLCKTCKKDYPECEVKHSDVVFSDGVGNDNICACNCYECVAKDKW